MGEPVMYRCECGWTGKESEMETDNIDRGEGDSNRICPSCKVWWMGTDAGGNRIPTASELAEGALERLYNNLNMRPKRK